MTTFIPGLELARQYYAEVVGPLLDQSFPGIPYSAALIGGGSDVLGFDSPRSTDHNWGPRLQVFLAPGHADLAGDIAGLLAGLLRPPSGAGRRHFLTPPQPVPSRGTGSR